ncbi:NAD(P)H-dependent oxidoreductase [Serratia marcescens]|jgi:Putative NADPH-quinone reductase (modulator of drug activity B)|uniref:NAD(P)H-dependent oxidoreductase n=1 Tax=Serratia TaxID=613 RepID=UPI000666739A|nr:MULTISPECIES: NAD(P)H-dependent oxidoreductase [Serratia]SAQ18138.1 glutathione-regulated potassium-efflux system ancillary protein KefF homolog [Klebsiella oxytoca]AWQ47960.1 NAD(P)H oxidoreductase [Serratia marcescens]ELQ9307333.1 NAD(P)H-dependent oxidoreductase [Serratia marcescens]ELQ9437466.1 NAD(P)H-dependent oxidoreductase [Serratia marcescens]ELT5558781.1 NAD(P)H-dependent oxidoreductase [Serratia marcescens]
MKTLVVVTHPDMANSVVNKRWLEELRRYPERYTVHELHQAYPDWQIDVAQEQRLIEAHDNIVLQFPIFWFSSPPLLKKWLDDVLTYGWAYGSRSGYKMQNKKLALAVTAGVRAEDYARDGRYRYSLEEIFRPFEVTAGYVRADYASFFAFYGKEAASDGTVEPLQSHELDRSAQGYQAFLAALN